MKAQEKNIAETGNSVCEGSSWEESDSWKGVLGD